MKFTQNFKRGVAMLLTLAMLVSSGNFGLIFSAFAASEDHDDHLHASLGQVIIDNLDSLNAQQEYLLKNGYLVADKQYHYAPPAEDAELVVVDSEGKTITAKPYTDTEGNLWIPTEFTLTGDAETVLETGALTADGEEYIGRYTAVERNFSVHITYSFDLNLSSEEKAIVAAMINAGVALNDDMDIVKYLSKVSVLDGVEESTKNKILDMVGGIDPNAELVLKAMVMELDRLGGQTAVDMIASLAKDGIYLPLLEENGENDFTVNEQGIFVNLGESTSAAYLGALSLKQQQDAQNALELAKVLDDYMELSDLALLAMHADKLEAALNSNYADLGAVSEGLKEIQPVINKYLTETVPDIYATVFGVVNDALAAYDFDKTVNSSDEFDALLAELKATYADGLKKINEKLAGTEYSQVATPEDIIALKAQLEKDYADNVKQINDLLVEYGYNGTLITDSTSLDAPIQWADEKYNSALAEINAKLEEYGYTGRVVTNASGMNRPMVWLEDQMLDALDELNAKLEEYGYTGKAVTGSADMDAVIAWLNGEYADGLAQLNKLLADNGYTGETVTGSADMDAVIAWLNGEYADGLAQLNKLLADNGYTGNAVTGSADMDAVIAWLNGEYADGLAELNQLLKDSGYTGKAITGSADMDAVIAWLNGKYADGLAEINTEYLPLLRENLDVTIDDITSSADIDTVIAVLQDARLDLLAQADAAAKEVKAAHPTWPIQSTIQNEEDVKKLIKDLDLFATMGIQSAQQAMDLAQQLLDGLETIAELVNETLPEGKAALEQAEEAIAKLPEGKAALEQAEEAMVQLADGKETLAQAEDAMVQLADGKETLAQAEDAKVLLEDGKETLKQAEEALELMEEAQSLLFTVEEAQAKIPEVREKMELAELAIETLGLMSQANEAIVKMDEVAVLLDQFDEGVAELDKQTDNLKLLIIVMDGFRDVVKPVVDTFENDGFNTFKLLKSGLSAESYAEIEEIIAGATVYTGEIPDSLHVAQATVKANVAKFDVKVTYKASVIDSSKNDSFDTIDLPVYEDTITLSSGATGADIKATIAALRLQENALASWGIDTDKFDIQVPELADDFLLVDDLEYTVIITPKTYKLTLDFGGEAEVLDVPYGYRYTTAIHSDSGKEYIYNVITDSVAELEQGSVWVVSGDTTITRSQGAVSERIDLLEVVAKTVETDATVKNILTSSTLKLYNAFSIRVPGKDQVSIKFDADRQVTVISAPDYDSRVGGMMRSVSPAGSLKWVATSVTVDGVTYPMTNGVYETANAFKAADVHYELALATDALGFGYAQILDALNTPYKLVADYNAQKATLDDLAELMPLLKRLNDEEDIISDPTPMTLREALGMIEHLQATYNLSDETVAAGKALYKMIPVNGHIALYDTMELYSHGGMYHYYRNEEAYKTQICLLDDLLQVLVNDESFMELVKDAAHGLFEEVKETLDAAADVMANVGIDHDKIDVTDVNLRTLLNLLEAAQPTLYSRVPTTFNWQENIHVTGLAYTNVEIQVTYGGVTYTEDFVEATGTTLTQAQLLAWAEEIKATHNIGPQYEEFFTVRNDFADTVLAGEDLTFNYTWDLNDYEIKAAGTDVVVGVVNYNYMHLDLPAHTEEGMRYDYMIGDLLISAGAYELGIEQFKGLVNGTIQVIRIEIDEEQELLQLQEDMLVDFVNHMEGAGIVTKDANGKYAVVFRLDYANLMDSFTKIGAGMFLGGYDYIGFDNHVFYGEGQYYVQAFIDALLTSGAGTHTILEEINEDGTLQHVVLENATVLTNVSHDNLGAEIMHSTAYFEKDGETLEADFYLTFDGTQADMQTLRSRIALVDQYLELTFEDNQAIAHLTMPEPVYAAYVAALVISGKIELRHINELDTQVALAFLVDMLNPMLDKDTAEWSAIMNTADMLVSGVGVDKIENAYENILNRIDTDKAQVIYEMITSSYDSEKVVYDDKSVYIPLENIQVKEVLDLVQAALNDYVDNKGAAGDINLSKIVAEYNTGVNINLTGHIENMGTDYAALFVSAKADGITNKAGMATAEELATIAENANLVVLLDDIDTDLTFNSSALVDLNGHTVNGNITGNSRLIIIDSAYQSTTAPMGTVTGTVTGATIISGKYDTDVSGLLPDGYVQEANGIVHNKLFTVGTDGANNLTLTLNADYDDLLSMIDVKGIMGIALDAAVETALNNYIYSSLYIDGNQVFDIHANDIVGMIAGNDKKQDIIDTLKSWVSPAGLKAIAQKIVSSLTDYDALYEAFVDGGDGIIYQADTLVTGYGITTEKIDNNGKPYYTVNIGGDATSTREGSLTVVVIGDLRLDMLLQAKALKDVIQNNISVDVSIDDVSADLNNKTLFISGDFAGEVVVDFRNNPEYVVMTAVILAAGNPDIRDELVAALNAYYAEGSTEELENAFNNLTAAQIIDGWNKVNRGPDTFTGMVNSLALTDEAKAEILASIDDEMLGFQLTVELGAVLLRKLSVDGTNRTLGSFLKTDANGNPYYGIAKSKDFLGEKGVKGYGVNYDISIENVGAKLYLFYTHQWDDGVVVKEADCENDGEILYTCLDCGKTKTEKIPAKGHNYGDWIITKQPTCSTTGVKAHYECSECNKYFNSSKVEVTYESLLIPMLEHTYGNLIPEVPADCETTGVKAHYKCSECNKYFDENKNEVEYEDLIIFYAHNYGDLIPEDPADCENTGVAAHYKCSLCDRYFNANKQEVAYEDLIIPITHLYGNLVALDAADCETDGMYAHYHCSRCDKYFDELKNEVDYKDLIIPKLGHYFGIHYDEVPASCTEDGLKEYYVCGMPETSTYSLRGRNGERPTCGKLFVESEEDTEEMIEVEYEDLIIPAPGHVYGNLIPKVPETCTEDGFEAHYLCSECNVYFDAGKNETTYEALVIPASHIYGNLIPQADPDCENTGLKEHYHCSRCDLYFDANKNEVPYGELIIPAKGHDYGDWVITKQPTCTEFGFKAHYQCSVCNKYFNSSKVEVTYDSLLIDKVPHTYGELIPEVPATCTEEGLKAHYKCSVCQHYFDENKNEVDYEDLIIPYAHDYGNLIPEDPATCTEEGLKAHYKCSKCGKYFDENKNEVAYEDLVIPMKEHNYGTLIPEVPASCTTTGMKAHYYDAECGKYFDENKNEVTRDSLIIPMKEHNFGTLIPEVPASCTTTGMKAHYYDADCGKYFDENKNEVTRDSLIIPMKEHNYGTLIPEVPASCTTTGMKAHYYDAECDKYFDENKNEVTRDSLIIPMKEHNYGTLIPEVPASCTTTGMKAHYYDADCGKYFDENKNEVTRDSLIIPMKEHNYGTLIPEVPASCTTTGMKAHYYDADCNKYFDENKNEVTRDSLIIPMKEHNFGTLIPEVPASCTTTGMKAHYYDADCGKYFDENKNEVTRDSLIIPMKEHNYGTLIPEVPASCTTTGMKAHYYDADCNKYFDENKNEVTRDSLIIPMKEHNFGTLIPEVPASCTTTGMKAHYYDADCNKYFDENKNEVTRDSLIIPMKEHNYGTLIPEVPASCTTTGMKAHYYDAECDKYFDENKNEVTRDSLIILMKEHNFGTLIPEVPADCENPGMKAHYYDAECGKYFDENKNEVAYADLIIPAKGHDYGDWVITKSATCTEPGFTAHYYCAECGKYFNSSKVEVTYESLIIPAKGHTYGDWVEEVPAQIGKEGMKGHYYDVECGKYFDANKNEVTRESLIIPALSASGTAPVLSEAVVTPGNGIYGGAVRTENGVKYLIVDADARMGLTFAQLKGMFPAISNNAECEKVTNVRNSNGAVDSIADTDLVATCYEVTFVATNEFGSDTATYILVVLGDLNCDGKNTSSDAADIKQFKQDNVPFGTRAQELAADINCDGTITSSDANTIKLKVLHSVNSSYEYATKAPTLAN